MLPDALQLEEDGVGVVGKNDAGEQTKHLGKRQRVGIKNAGNTVKLLQS